MTVSPSSVPGSASIASADDGDLGSLGDSVALLSHYAAVDGDFRTTAERLAGLGTLKCVLGPQHGFWGETQDNMIEWSGYRDPVLGVPVHSLYGETRRPTPEMLEGADALVVDLQDVGSRYYTYVYTMALAMRQCADMGLPVTVLDRPNPLGTAIAEGRMLDPEYASFVGLYPIPVRHGLTIGELAGLFADIDGIPRPEVVACSPEPPRDPRPESDWVHPSPNMPSARTALVYPGMCLLEGTNLSEGRGTTRPFEVFGAPWLDDAALCAELNGSAFMQGAVLRRHRYIPTFGKHAGTMCMGGQIHVTDAGTFRPYRAGLGILAFCMRHPESVWKPPPYEYESEKMPIDILAGGPEVRQAVEDDDSDRLLELAAVPLQRWKRTAEEAMIYSREMQG